MHLKFWNHKSTQVITAASKTELDDSLGIPDSPATKPPMSEFIPRSPSPQAGPLTVVELFQSQGCSSCPPANSNVIAVADDPNVLVLTYEVTYWVRTRYSLDSWVTD